MTATEIAPEIDVWSWTTEANPDLGHVLDVKKAVLVHSPLRTAIDGHLAASIGDNRLEGLARWMLAQYHRAWDLLKDLPTDDPVVTFARAECCLKGTVADGDAVAMRRPDLAASSLSGHPALKKDGRVYALYMDALLFDHDLEGTQKALDDAPADVKAGAAGSYVEGRLAEVEGNYREAKSCYMKAI